MLPVLNAPPSAVAVWVVPPVLCHATVCAARTVAGFGEKDMLPLIPTIVMVTSAPPRGLVGVELELDEHPVAAARSAAATA